MSTYSVTMVFDVGPRVTHADIVDYIKIELESAGGCRDPADPLFGSFNNVEIEHVILIK